MYGNSDKPVDFSKKPQYIPPKLKNNVSKSLMLREFGFKAGRAPAEFEAIAEDKLVMKDYSEKQCKFPVPTRSTFLMVFSPDGKKVASTHGNHNVYVSDLKTGKVTNTLSGHPRTPWCIAFHPSSNQILATGCLGGQVRVWDLHGGSEVWVAEAQTVIASLTFHPTDRMLVIATYNELHFWDWSQSAPFAKCFTSNEKEKVRYVTFDPLGHKLITGISNAPPYSSQWDRSAASYNPPHYHHHHFYHVGHLYGQNQQSGNLAETERDPGGNNIGNEQLQQQPIPQGTTPTPPPRTGANGRNVAPDPHRDIDYRTCLDHYERTVQRYFDMFRSRQIPTTDRGTDPMDMGESSRNGSHQRTGTVPARQNNEDRTAASTSSSSSIQPDTNSNLSTSSIGNHTDSTDQSNVVTHSLPVCTGGNSTSTNATVVQSSPATVATTVLAPSRNYVTSVAHLRNGTTMILTNPVRPTGGNDRSNLPGSQFSSGHPTWHTLRDSIGGIIATQARMNALSCERNSRGSSSAPSLPHDRPSAPRAFAEELRPGTFRRSTMLSGPGINRTIGQLTPEERAEQLGTIDPAPFSEGPMSAIDGQPITLSSHSAFHPRAPWMDSSVRDSTASGTRQYQLHPLSQYRAQLEQHHTRPQMQRQNTSEEPGQQRPDEQPFQFQQQQLQEQQQQQTASHIPQQPPQPQPQPRVWARGMRDIVPPPHIPYTLRTRVRSEASIRHGLHVLNRRIENMQTLCRARLELLQLQQVRRLWNDLQHQIQSLQGAVHEPASTTPPVPVGTDLTEEERPTHVPSVSQMMELARISDPRDESSPSHNSHSESLPGNNTGVMQDEMSDTAQVSDHSVLSCEEPVAKRARKDLPTPETPGHAFAGSSCVAGGITGTSAEQLVGTDNASGTALQETGQINSVNPSIAESAVDCSISINVRNESVIQCTAKSQQELETKPESTKTKVRGMLMSDVPSCSAEVRDCMDVDQEDLALNLQTNCTSASYSSLQSEILNASETSQTSKDVDSGDRPPSTHPSQNELGGTLANISGNCNIGRTLCQTSEHESSEHNHSDPSIKITFKPGTSGQYNEDTSGRHESVSNPLALSFPSEIGGNINCDTQSSSMTSSCGFQQEQHSPLHSSDCNVESFPSVKEIPSLQRRQTFNSANETSKPESTHVASHKHCSSQKRCDLHRPRVTVITRLPQSWKSSDQATSSENVCSNPRVAVSDSGTGTTEEEEVGSVNPSTSVARQEMNEVQHQTSGVLNTDNNIDFKTGSSSVSSSRSTAPSDRQECAENIQPDLSASDIHERESSLNQNDVESCANSCNPENHFRSINDSLRESADSEELASTLATRFAAALDGVERFVRELSSATFGTLPMHSMSLPHIDSNLVSVDGVNSDPNAVSQTSTNAVPGDSNMLTDCEIEVPAAPNATHDDISSAQQLPFLPTSRRNSPVVSEDASRRNETVPCCCNTLQHPDRRLGPRVRRYNRRESNNGDSDNAASQRESVSQNRSVQSSTDSRPVSYGDSATPDDRFFTQRIDGAPFQRGGSVQCARASTAVRHSSVSAPRNLHGPVPLRYPRMMQLGGRYYMQRPRLQHNVGNRAQGRPVRSTSQLQLSRPWLLHSLTGAYRNSFRSSHIEPFERYQEFVHRVGGTTTNSLPVSTGAAAARREQHANNSTVDNSPICSESEVSGNCQPSNVQGTSVTREDSAQQQVVNISQSSNEAEQSHQSHSRCVPNDVSTTNEARSDFSHPVGISSRISSDERELETEQQTETSVESTDITGEVGVQPVQQQENTNTTSAGIDKCVAGNSVCNQQRRMFTIEDNHNNTIRVHPQQRSNQMSAGQSSEAASGPRSRSSENIQLVPVGRVAMLDSQTPCPGCIAAVRNEVRNTNNGEFHLANSIGLFRREESGRQVTSEGDSNTRNNSSGSSDQQPVSNVSNEAVTTDDNCGGGILYVQRISGEMSAGHSSDTASGSQSDSLENIQLVPVGRIDILENQTPCPGCIAAVRQEARTNSEIQLMNSVAELVRSEESVRPVTSEEDSNIRNNSSGTSDQHPVSNASNETGTSNNDIGANETVRVVRASICISGPNAGNIVVQNAMPHEGRSTATQTPGPPLSEATTSNQPAPRSGRRRPIDRFRTTQSIRNILNRMERIVNRDLECLRSFQRARARSTSQPSRRGDSQESEADREARIRDVWNSWSHRQSDNLSGESLDNSGIPVLAPAAQEAVARLTDVLRMELYETERHYQRTLGLGCPPQERDSSHVESLRVTTRRRARQVVAIMVDSLTSFFDEQRSPVRHASMTWGSRMYSLYILLYLSLEITDLLLSQLSASSDEPGNREDSQSGENPTSANTRGRRDSSTRPRVVAGDTPPGAARAVSWHGRQGNTRSTSRLRGGRRAVGRFVPGYQQGLQHFPIPVPPEVSAMTSVLPGGRREPEGSRSASTRGLRGRSTRGMPGRHHRHFQPTLWELQRALDMHRSEGEHNSDSSLGPGRGAPRRSDTFAVPAVQLNDIPIADVGQLSQSEPRVRPQSPPADIFGYLPSRRIHVPSAFNPSERWFGSFADEPNYVPGPDGRLRSPPPFSARSFAGAPGTPDRRRGYGNWVPPIWRSRFLHPRYLGYSFMAEVPDDGFSTFDNFNCMRDTPSPNHRIQAWDVSKFAIPDISNADKNLIVAESKIHNDASVDVSKDGTLLVTLLPPNRMCVNTMLGIYSLQWESLGQCLYTTSFEQNAVSVSLSPACRHLLVGLGSRRVVLPTDRLIVAQVFRMEGAKPGLSVGGRGRLCHLRDIEQYREHGFSSINCIRWAPQPGQGLVYGTNTGALRILQ